MSFSRNDGRILLILAAIAILAVLISTATSSSQSSHLQKQIAEITSPKSHPKIDLSQANYLELLEIDGIGPVLAKRLLSHRMLYGPFLSWEELDKIEGIGPKTLEKIRESAVLCLAGDCP